MAHQGKKVQMEIVAVLALISLFTHNHIFWIAGLLLAMVDLPDFSTPFASIARSLEKISGRDTKAEVAIITPPEVPVIAPPEPEPKAQTGGGI